MKLSPLLVLLSAEIAVGFAPSLSRASRSISLPANKQSHHDDSLDSSITNGGRRAAISILLTGAAMLPALTVASPVMAQEELFKANPLTNGVLEQIRIWNQDSVDDIKYGGELEAGDAGNKGKVEAYPRLLVPIVEIANDLTTVNQLVRDQDRVASWTKARTILAKPQYEKLAFKKIFNAYGDNIYYSDPDRANAYLGGGASPKSEQSLAYLLRNDVLTNLENLQAELDYLLKPSTPESESSDDLYGYAQTAKTAMDKYLTLAPPTELKKAMELIAG